MEVGKLVTSETCGCIFYFSIDETHPDEPQQGAVRTYYVVAHAVSTFSYREAYCVLCRALCGLDNRTYLHRWHALYEQIFGTTPYIQFLHAVRDSPATVPNTFTHISTSPSRHTHAPPPAVVLPALFLDETTARLALHKAEREHTAAGVSTSAGRPAQHHTTVQHDLHYHPPDGVSQGCATPVSIQAIARGKQNAVAADSVALVSPTEVQTAPDSAAPQVNPQLAELLRMASQWQETAAGLRSESRESVERLQQDLQEERQRRRVAEAKALRQAQALEAAQALRQVPETPPPPIASAVEAKGVAAVDLREKEENAVLRRRVQELEARWSAVEAHHAQERARLETETENLQQRLRQQSDTQGAQIRDFLRDNAGAVKRVEEALEKREKELCAVYTTALEERDVRIAQLSQEVLQHLHNARQAPAAPRGEEAQRQAERVAHLEGMSAQLKEWNEALRRQLGDAVEEIQELRERLARAHQRDGEVVKSSLHAPLDGNRLLSPLRCNVCAGLPHAAAVQLATELCDTQRRLQMAKADAEHKSGELRRAALVIEQLTCGVREAAIDMNVFRPRKSPIVQQAP